MAEYFDYYVYNWTSQINAINACHRVLIAAKWFIKLAAGKFNQSTKDIPKPLIIYDA